MMTSVGKNMLRLTHDAMGSSKKRAQISRCMKKAGLLSLGKGAWLAHRGPDVVSGFVVEGAPLDTYISMFVLPTFDKLKFVSWSLGHRAVHCSLENDTIIEVCQAIELYKNSIKNVKSSLDLLSYIEFQDIYGYYPLWVRYICYLRQFDFISAINCLNDGNSHKLHAVELEKFNDVNKFVLAGDNKGVSQVLEGWKLFSERIFGPFDQGFEVF